MQPELTIGIFTLAGAAVGGLITWGVQAFSAWRQRKHENETRFHDLRAKIYVDFVTSATNIMGKKQNGCTDEKLIDDRINFSGAMAGVNLLCSKNVQPTFNVVLDSVQDINNNGWTPGKEVTTNKAFGQFFKSARRELKV